MASGWQKCDLISQEPKQLEMRSARKDKAEDVETHGVLGRALASPAARANSPVRDL